MRVAPKGCMRRRCAPCSGSSHVPAPDALDRLWRGAETDSGHGACSGILTLIPPPVSCAAHPSAPAPSPSPSSCRPGRGPRAGVRYAGEQPGRHGLPLSDRSAVDHGVCQPGLHGPHGVCPFGAERRWSGLVGADQPPTRSHACGEYAGNGWSLGLRYNASLFHNNTSTLVWDNPTNLSGTGAACTDAAGFSNTSTGTDANRGPCRGRMDLYPSNQAHTWTLSGAAKLPLKSHFMGTASYGFRLQNDPFLSQTTNSALAARSVSRESLDGDVRPTMINATLVNRYFDPLDIKAYYRLYDFDNRSKQVDLAQGRVHADSSVDSDSQRSFPWAYSKQNIGLDASRNITRWLSAKMGYVYENLHRERREVLDSNEHTFGPTFDIKPTSWLLIRLGYKRSLRDAHDYDGGRFNVVNTSLTKEEMEEEVLEELRKFDEAARTRDKFSYFGQITPWQNLTLFGGFDFFLDEYPRTVIGVQDDLSYVPSAGFTYAPLEWVSLFGNYSWERFDWNMQAIDRTATTQTTTTDPLRTWRSRGRDQTNTVSFGTDMKLIENLLGLRIQYTFSEGSSLVKASGDS